MTLPMPSAHPVIAVRAPDRLYEAITARAADLGMSANSYLLMLAADALGFVEHRTDDSVVADLLKRHMRESKAQATQQARKEDS